MTNETKATPQELDPNDGTQDPVWLGINVRPPIGCKAVDHRGEVFKVLGVDAMCIFAAVQSCSTLEVAIFPVRDLKPYVSERDQLLGLLRKHLTQYAAGLVADELIEVGYRKAGDQDNG